jgi:hypothetical protein
MVALLPQVRTQDNFRRYSSEEGFEPRTSDTHEQMLSAIRKELS